MNYGVKSMMKLCFYDKSTDKLFAYFPFGNSMTISVTGDKVEAMANGTTAVTWSSNRKASAQLETQIISPKLLAIVLGATHAENQTGNMAHYEGGKLGSAAPTFTLQETPALGTLSVFLVKNDGATVISELTAVASSPTASQYSIEGKIITTHVTNAGANVLCIYAKAETTLEKTTIKADEFAKAFRITGVGLVKGIDGVERLQSVQIPNATAQSNMDFTYSSSDAASFNFSLDLAADPVTQELFSLITL